MAAKHSDIRRKAFQEVRASVRAEILLDPDRSVPAILEAVTKVIDHLIDRESK